MIDNEYYLNLYLHDSCFSYAYACYQFYNHDIYFVFCNNSPFPIHCILKNEKGEYYDASGVVTNESLCESYKQKTIKITKTNSDAVIFIGGVSDDDIHDAIKYIKSTLLLM